MFRHLSTNISTGFYGTRTIIILIRILRCSLIVIFLYLESSWEDKCGHCWNLWCECDIFIGNHHHGLLSSWASIASLAVQGSTLPTEFDIKKVCVIAQSCFLIGLSVKIILEKLLDKFSCSSMACSIHIDTGECCNPINPRRVTGGVSACIWSISHWHKSFYLLTPSQARQRATLSGDQSHISADIKIWCVNKVSQSGEWCVYAMYWINKILVLLIGNHMYYYLCGKKNWAFGWS